MKKIKVNLILVLVISAMLALLFIQAFQTVQLFDRKTTEFNSKAQVILERIALRHEKAEEIRHYMQLANKDLNIRYKDILKEEFKNLLSAKESISIEDTSIYNNGKMENYLIIKGKVYDSISGTTTEQRVLARDVRQLRDLYNRKPNQEIDKDSIRLAVQLDQRVIQQIFKKARFVNEMMLAAFKTNNYIDPSTRLDIFFLDSVIKTELQAEKLPEDFIFNLTSENKSVIKFKQAPSNYTSKINLQESHKTTLHPSNALDDDITLNIVFPKQKSFLFAQIGGVFLLNLILVALIIIALSFMFKTILSQNKLSTLKNDFISNMTHEFKTPISTISLACEAMSDSDMNRDVSTSTSPYVSIIQEENTRLGLLVEKILQSATLNKGEIKLNKESICLNELLCSIVEKASFRTKNIQGEISLNIQNELIYLQADKFHFNNLISNLIDNAIKYSNNAPKIDVSVRKENQIISIAIKDKGIGMKKEHLNKIFDNLYRIPTGNIHNVKGFGLGLSYVKAITNLHNWEIKVNSTPNEGSEFILRIKETL